MNYTEEKKIAISCIVPVYNTEKYLYCCIDSILTQVFSNFELILIDDGSSDNSGKICDEYAEKDKRVKVIHQKNKGAAGARNIGLKIATGEYISFVDSDDWIEKDYFESFYIEAKKTSSDIIGCDLFFEKKQGNCEKKYPLPIEPQDCLRMLLEGKVMGWLHIKFFKASLFFNKDCTFVNGLDMIEDLLICTKLFFYAKKISYISKPLYHYNMCNQNSQTSNLNENKIKQIIDVVENIEQFLKYHNCEENYSNAVLKRKSFSKIWILTGCEKLKDDYLELYNDEKLSKCCLNSLKYKIVFRLCELKFYKLARLLILLQRFLLRLKNA